MDDRVRGGESLAEVEPVARTPGVVERARTDGETEEERRERKRQKKADRRERGEDSKRNRSTDRPHELREPDWQEQIIALAPPRQRKKHSVGLIAFFLLVVLPTFIVAAYMTFFAADLYVSETRFWVRGQKMTQSSVISSALGIPPTSSSPEDALSLRDYLLSHDAVNALEKKIGLRAIYTRDEADYFSRLASAASLESMVDYHRGMISFLYNTTSGIVTLRVTAFRKKDAHALALAVLESSEDLVNKFNERAQQEALRVARNEVRLAEERVLKIREQMTAFRERTRAIDPTQSTATVISVINSLESRLSIARSEIAELRTYLAPDSQQIVTLKARIGALEQELERERTRLTGDSGALAPIVAEYEKLVLQRTFADTGLTSSLTSLEAARVEAQRQQLFIVRVINPHEPQRPDYYQRWIVVVAVFAGTLLMFGIGALVISAIRDRMG
jgi:capsular polysaccharide transport system permease protein